MGQEDREKFDKALADANRQFMRLTTSESAEAAPKRKVPSWWPKDEAQVTHDNLEAARNLGYSIGGIK